MIRAVARVVVVVAALGLAGCPDDDMPPPPVPVPASGAGPPASPARDREQTPKEGGSSVTPERSSSSSREQLLAMTPEQALADGLRGDGPGGLAPRLAGEGALAMAEQLRAAQVPVEALDLCVVVFDQARERAHAGTLPEPALQELQRAVKVQAGDRPALLAWAQALAGRVYLRQDLEAAVTFLVKVREVRAFADAANRGR